MLPFQLAHYTAVPEWEGKVPWLYLDSHQPNPLPTAGIGCAINGLAESLTLGWTVNGVAPSPEQITSDWKRVTAMPGSRLAKFYFAAGCPQLPEASMASLVAKRYGVFTPELLDVFADFLSWPVPAQTGTLDLIWGVGARRFREYSHFRAAAQSHNWKACAAACAEQGAAYAKRNAWRSDLFLQAA